MINISRFGDLTLDSEGILSSRPTIPIEAGKNVFKNKCVIFESKTCKLNMYNCFNT